jgi:enoyl-CoA hydratase/carnithine racemase
MPERQAVNLCISASTLTAEQAQNVGIVTHIAPPDKLDEVVTGIVSGLLKLSPTAIRKGLEAADELRNIGLPQHHSFLKNKLNDIVSTKDAAEGIMAFIEKREPNWTGE